MGLLSPCSITLGCLAGLPGSELRASSVPMQLRHSIVLDSAAEQGGEGQAMLAEEAGF